MQTEEAGGAAEAATAATASAADVVELAVSWQKQAITIHVEPSESVQVRRRSWAKPHMLLSKPPVAAAQHCPSLNAVFLCTGPPQGIKRKLEAATSVSEKRMKLLGLKVQAGGAARGWQGPCRAVGRLAKCVWCSHAWCAECTCYCRSLLHHHCMCTCLLPTDLPSAHCLRAQVRSGKPAGDADLVADLLLKPGAKIMMMGCVAAGAA